MYHTSAFKTCLLGALSAAALLPAIAAAFDSGSTGVDGDFSPAVDTVLPLPPDGVFNFTNVNIPVGVTVTFSKNTLNTPVTILASGDVVIAGTLHVNGAWSTPVGAAGDGNIGDDGLPGQGGPGGHAGGAGGEVGNGHGGSGQGPGAGQGGRYYSRGGSGSGGGGAGFRENGTEANRYDKDAVVAAGGDSYGSELLLPLVGGSGGGGGAGGSAFRASGGGGGGGALLIAASGTVSVTGSVGAGGGNSGSTAGAGVGGSGGGGSGGGIRIVATRIEGDGAILARGGQYGSHDNWYCRGGAGSGGRIRLEAEVFARTEATTPAFSFGEPSTVFIAGLPTLRIVSVAGVAAPAEPTGSADIVLPSDTPNPVTVVFETTGVPVGNTVKLTVTPAYGDRTSVVSPALTGTTDQASASVSVDLPEGPSVLSAQTTYTIVASLGDAFSRYAQGERVEKIRLTANTAGESTITLITVSGKEFVLPGRLPAMPAG